MQNRLNFQKRVTPKTSHACKATCIRSFRAYKPDVPINHKNWQTYQSNRYMPIHIKNIANIFEAVET